MLARKQGSILSTIYESLYLAHLMYSLDLPFSRIGPDMLYELIYRPTLTSSLVMNLMLEKTLVLINQQRPKVIMDRVNDESGVVVEPVINMLNQRSPKDETLNVTLLCCQFVSYSMHAQLLLPISKRYSQK